MIHYSDFAIIEGLRLHSDYIIKYVYKEFFPSIRYLIKTNAGLEEDAEDIFQEALYIILKKIQEDEFELSSSFLTYLYSISRNLWLQRLKRKRLIEHNHDELVRHFSSPQHNSEKYVEDEEKYDVFIKQFDNLSEDCKRLLQLFLGKMSLKEIAEEMGYKSEFYAKTKKYLCKEALKRMVENDPAIKALL